MTVKSLSLQIPLQMLTKVFPLKAVRYAELQKQL